MEFDIDVSGSDIFEKDYTICIANKEDAIKGFKFSPEILFLLNTKFAQNLYRYPTSKNGRTLLKVRIYSIVVYYLFKSLVMRGNLSLNVCRDFDGHEHDITSNLKYLLPPLGFNLERITFCRLSKDSNAHHYAYLMRKDNKNQMKDDISISSQDIEQFLKK
ncbi:hypothetical protein HYU14_00690 [Candidatus Woesearchaeota archaeon]|nr:hypothetical protein [Candidatus Woesearchaeota archaeon]